MDLQIKDTLTAAEEASVRELYRAGEVSIFQHPSYLKIFFPSSQVRYALAFDRQKLIFYAAVHVYRSNLLPMFSKVHVKHPYYRDQATAVEALHHLTDHFKGIGASSLKLELAFDSEAKTISSIEQSLVQRFQSHFHFQDAEVATLQIDLTSEMETIRTGYKNVLQKNLRSAKNKGLYCQQVHEASELKAFADMYKAMCIQKGISSAVVLDVDELIRLSAIDDSGLTIGVYTPGKQLIGGALITIGLNTAEYLLGASDPEFRNYPCSHLALDQAIETSKNMGLRCFDLGGIKHMAEEGTPYASINSFKMTFTEHLVFGPKPFTIILNPLKNRIHDLMIRLRN